MTITKNVWKVAALLLILCLITAVMISGTYAKYTSTYAGHDTALVAKWNIVASGGALSMGTDPSTRLELFNHEYDNHVTTSAGGFYIVAPGVGGDFNLQFQNNSDVDAQVTFDFAKAAGSANVPIVYYTTSASITYDAAGLAAALGTVNVTKGALATQTVHWSWPWSEDPTQNAIDTPLGVSSAALTGSGQGGRTVYNLNVTASAVQVEPTTTP